MIYLNRTMPGGRRRAAQVIFTLSLLVFVCAVCALMPVASQAEELRGGAVAVEAKKFGVIMPKESKLAPDFTLKDSKEKSYRMSDFKGDVIFLHFWATWCKPCRKEMPMLDELRRNLEGKGLRVIGVAVDRGSFGWTQKTVGRFVRKHGVKMAVVLDHDNDVRKLYDVSMLPTTYIIGRDGRFVGKIVGGRKWNSPESHNLFRAILE